MIAAERLVTGANAALPATADHTEIARWLEDCGGFGISAAGMPVDADGRPGGRG